MKVIALLFAIGWNAAAQLPVSIDSARPSRVLALQGDTRHVQGIDTDGVHLWMTAVDRPARKGYLYQFAVEDGRMERRIEVEDGDRYHPGGIATDDASIWVSVAEYRASSTSVIQQRSKSTLHVLFQFSVPDHIGCLAVTPKTIIGGNWDSREFYIWDHRGVLLRKVANSGGNSYQDLKFHAGYLVASGLLAGRKSAIDWLDPATLTVQQRLSMGNTDRGEPFAREGMTIFQGGVWLVPEDAASRLFVFSVKWGPKLKANPF